MNKIKFIFFDLGYTLVNEDAVWIERCKEQSETRQAKLSGITADILLQDIKAASTEFKPQWKSVIAKYGFTWSATYKNELETLYDDAYFVLEELNKQFCLGIIANQSGNLSERLQNWRIDKFFATVVSSADYGFSKPDERLFDVALKLSGCKASDSVMIGDRLDNDILPANKLGFRTVRIKQGFAKNQVAPSRLYEPDHEVDNLTEILKLPFI